MSRDVPNEELSLTEWVCPHGVGSGDGVEPPGLRTAAEHRSTIGTDVAGSEQ